MSPAPENLDWVTSRVECSVAKVFARLSLGVKSDVEIRSSILGTEGGPTFEFYGQDRAFMVTRRIGQNQKQVDLVLKDGKVIVEGHMAKFEAEPGLNHQGRCTGIVVWRS